MATGSRDGLERVEVEDRRTLSIKMEQESDPCLLASSDERFQYRAPATAPPSLCGRLFWSLNYLDDLILIILRIQE